MLVPAVRKIAVLRANALGDFLVLLPVFDALRAAYPDAEIVLLGSAWHAGFLHQRSGAVNRVVVAPPYGGVTTGEDGPHQSPEIAAFVAAMRAEMFDLAFQWHGGGRNSNELVRRLGARVTCGARTPDAPNLDRTIPYARWQHETLRCLEIAALAGVGPVTLQPHLVVTAEDDRQADRVVVEGVGPLVAIHPGASDPERWWPAERFAAIADDLAAHGARVVLVGIEEEREQIERVLGAMTAEALNLCGCLTLRGLTGLMARCRLVVGNDSGPLHLAEAVGTATMGVYSFFGLLTYGPLERARHRAAVSWRTEPVGCETRCGSCELCRSFLTDVPVEEVLGPCRELLGF